MVFIEEVVVVITTTNTNTNTSFSNNKYYKYLYRQRGVGWLVGWCSKGGGNKSPNTGIPAQLILDDVTQMGIKTTLSTKEHNTKHSKHNPNQKDS